MEMFLEFSKILSSIYVYVIGSPAKYRPPTLNIMLASENT
jgi:hypothetical protein